MPPPYHPAMAHSAHTYGPSCLLHAESNTFTRRASEVALGPPPIKPHFFYCSPLPIDDPLSAVPPPSDKPSARTTRLPPRPFSLYDNASLEDAWIKVHTAGHETNTSPGKIGADDSKVKSEEASGTSTLKNGDNAEAEIPSRGRDTDQTKLDPASTPNAVKSKKKRSKPQEGVKVDAQDAIQPQRVKIASPDHAQDASQDNASTLQQTAKSQNQGTQSSMNASSARLIDEAKGGLCNIPSHLPFDNVQAINAEELERSDPKAPKRRKSRSPFRKSKEQEKANGSGDAAPYRRLSTSTQRAQDNKLGASPSDTTGTPFLRITSRLRRSRSRSPNSQARLSQADGTASSSSFDRPRSQHASVRRSSIHNDPRIDQQLHEQTMDNEDHHSSLAENENGQRQTREDLQTGVEQRQKQLSDMHVVVGVSRLHIVSMSNLKMGPLYWDAVHDISSVTRGTWFYKETMWPVESQVANQIEEGYEYIKPWTLTYNDELNSCLEIGPEAELKLVHRLWPAEQPPSEAMMPSSGKNKDHLLKESSEKLNAEERELKSAILTAELPSNRAAGVLDGFDDPVRLFSRCSLIFANARDAQILRPSQLPSVARGRKPLASIRKGKPVGVPVIRGFDYQAWERLYTPAVKPAIAAKTRPDGMPLRAATTNSSRSLSCDACLSAKDRPRPTDLVLVIHGIGQKLSERVESFHFTHSINAFRRQVNMELVAEDTRPWLRDDFGGIMVLPVNWRSKMRLDEADPKLDINQRTSGSDQNQYTLQDITEQSIPAVRSLISDVLLDIPYYLSHHKPRMIEAVIREANRVYRLWCNNNPGFHDSGRVHILAHSLGTVMTLDILSNQPTQLPSSLDFAASEPRTDIFEFDTKNLFFAGSPAGLFLFLNHATLLPRKAREKPDVDFEDCNSRVTGEQGTYGCLAVDNLYNIVHHIDPIAYRLNACVDVDYACALQPASVPSTAQTWAQYILRTKPAIPIKPLPGLESLPERPKVQSMPSTVELETHNFSREEVAEKRMFLLNDNGQIDFTLRSGGGPLEIQYLNMLGAHSSYWTLRDFIRFIVVEIGRKPGKLETLPTLKAQKKARATKRSAGI